MFFLTVAGLGFGLMSGLFSLINVLADSVGPGTVGLYGDSNYFFLTSGKILVRGVWYSACTMMDILLLIYFKTVYNFMQTA